MARNIRSWPVMKSMCASCPFAESGSMELRCAVIARTTLTASQICHHPRIHGKKETHLCRGARDHQLTILHRLGWLSEPTDEAFMLTSARAGVV